MGFNKAATDKYQLREFNGYIFSIERGGSKVKFEFIDDMDDDMFEGGFRSLSRRSHPDSGVYGRGSDSLMQGVPEILRPYKKKELLVSYRCALYEGKGHLSSYPVLCCDLTTKEELFRAEKGSVKTTKRR